MEVDQEGHGAPKVPAPKDYLGTPNFDQGLRAGEDKRGKEACAHPMDQSPLGPTLPTTMSPQAFGPSTTNPPPPPPPPNGKPIQGADQSDAMAMKVERMAQQKEIEKEQFRAVLKQKDDELAQIKERYQRELDNNTAAHQEHLRNMENKISEVEADHDTKKQSQRELELRLQDVASKNALLEAELVRRDQSQEEKEVAESIIRSQEEDGAIDVDAEDAKGENATPRDDEFAPTKLHQDGNVTPTDRNQQAKE